MPITINDTNGNQTYLLDDEDYIIIDTYGNDTYHLGNGNNDITDSWGDDIYHLGDGNNDITDTWGNNVYYLGNGINTINDSHGDDIYYLGNGTTTVDGGWGHDTYYLNGTNNRIIESYGMDTFIAGADIDYIDGGNLGYIQYQPFEAIDIDSDTVDYSNSPEAVQIDLLNGTASGGYAEGDTLISIENIIGSDSSDPAARDFLYGDEGVNELYGMAGNDILEGDGGADYIDGGDGWDYARYTRSTEGVNINLETGIHTGGDAAGDTLVNIEAVTGSNYDDTFRGNASVNHFYGGNGNDTFFGDAGGDYYDGQGGNDTVNYSASAEAVNIDLLNKTASGGDAEKDRLLNIENIVGSDLSSGRDFLYGDEGVNELYGMAGDDILEGGAGADYIDGGAGWDYARYTRSSEGVNINLETGIHTGGDAAGDTLINIEAIAGSNYNDTFFGNASANHFYGGNGDDTFFGDAGGDYYDGQGGNDTVNYSTSASGIIVDLNETLQTFYRFSLNGPVLRDGGDALGDRFINIESIYGSNFNDEIYGYLNNNNFLYGGDGDDIITGGNMNDIIYGGSGDDQLAAGGDYLTPSGTDHLHGGSGNDTYTFKGGDSFFYETGTDHDTISFDGTIYSLDFLRLDGNTIFATDRYGVESSITLNDINLFEEFIIEHDDSNTQTHYCTLAEFKAALTDDYFVATAAAETFNGMGGFDTIDYSSSIAAVTINSNSGSGGFAQGDTYDLINKIVGSDYSDTFYAYDIQNFDGGDGDDLFIAGSNINSYVFDGGNGHDTVDFSNIGNVTVNGIPQSVDINLENGTFIGYGLDNDTYTNVEGVIGTKNNDTFRGDANDNMFKGGDGNDTIYGGSGVDDLYGEAGADTFIFDEAVGKIDNLFDFDISEGDILNISSILSGYDPLSDAISDFVQITDNGTDSFVAVDADGGADNFITIAQLHGVTGLDVDNMETNGNLITV